jgi:hypothetical protein
MGGLLDAESHARELHEEALEQHFLTVTSSPHFLRAETLRKLLLYLWQNRQNNISEYAVGTEALGRRSDFDPKTDASVRVQISRLRRKLKDFYELEGIHEVCQLQIPVGTHSLMVVRTTSAALHRPAARSATEIEEPFAAPRRRRAPLYLLCVVVAILTCVSGWLLWQRHVSLSAVKSDAVTATVFWKNFATPGTPVKIILPTPTFFTFPIVPSLHVRDTDVNDYDHWTQSSALRREAAAAGPPSLDQAYTVTSDTLAAISLGRYLDRVKLGQDVSFEVTADRSMDLLEKSSVVAFGAHSTLHPFRDYLATMNFSVSEGEASVDNAHPEPGEQKQYLFSKPGKGVTIEPALVAVLPGRSKGKKLIILQARHTSSLIELLTSRVGDEMVQRMYRQHGSPEFFEMVVQSELNGDHAVRCWPVAMHTYTKQAPAGDVTQ